MPRYSTLFSLWFVSQLFIYSLLGSAVNLGITLSWDRVVCALIVMKFCSEFAANPGANKSFDAVDKCMLFFLGYATISLFIGGADEGEPARRWLAALFNIAYFPFITYQIGKRGRFRHEDFLAILKCLMVISFYLTVTAGLERLKLTQLIWPQYIMDPDVGINWGRSRGPFVAPDVLGRVLIQCFLCMTLLWQYVRGGARARIVIGTMMISAAIYLTNTRSPWIAYGMALIMTLTLASKSVRLPAKLVFLVAGLVFISGGASKFSAGKQTLFGQRSETVDYRLVNYATTIEMIKSHALFGIGYGMFVKEWPKYFSADDSATIQNLNDGNHNTFLGMFAELGLVGISCFVAIIALSAWKVFKMYREFRTVPEEQNFLMVCLALVLVFVFMGQLVDFRFKQMPNNITFLFLGWAANPAWRRILGGQRELAEAEPDPGALFPESDPAAGHGAPGPA